MSQPMVEEEPTSWQNLFNNGRPLVQIGNERIPEVLNNMTSALHKITQNRKNWLAEMAGKLTSLDIEQSRKMTQRRIRTRESSAEEQNKSLLAWFDESIEGYDDLIKEWDKTIRNDVLLSQVDWFIDPEVVKKYAETYLPEFDHPDKSVRYQEYKDGYPDPNFGHQDYKLPMIKELIEDCKKLIEDTEKDKNFKETKVNCRELESRRSANTNPFHILNMLSQTPGN